MSQKQLREGSWQLLQLLDQAPGLAAMAGTLADMADKGHPVVAGTADLKYSNGLVRFEERHPGRLVQFGISEQNMVTAAAGMATVGLRPYVATFASFLALLCCEQIRTDVADTASLSAALWATVDHDGPIYFRIGRGRDPEVYSMADVEFELGKAIVHSRGQDLTIIATGSMVHPSSEAVQTLRSEGWSVGLIDMHTIKPLDKEAILEAVGD